MERVPLHPGECLYLHQADCGNLADFRKCPLLGDQPLFLSGTLETLFSLFHIHFLIGFLRLRLSSHSLGQKLPFSNSRPQRPRRFR